jgi:hypothetical protein
VKRVGKNDYINEFKYFNPWITHTGVITWVPEVRLHTKCLIKVRIFYASLFYRYPIDCVGMGGEGRILEY